MDLAGSDRIEKKILLRAPRSRVWHALIDADQFGAWFRVKLEGNFAVGKTVKGQILHPGYEHCTMAITVERMEAEQLFSYRWHPHAVDPTIDYSTEPTTLVEFQLDEVADGTLLTVVESGFDRIPIGRRLDVYRMNTHGWAVQTENIQRYLHPGLSPRG